MTKRRSPRSSGYNTAALSDLLPTCDQPTKVRFYAEHDAQERVDRHASSGTYMRAYQCDEHWHLTSKEPR